MAVWLQAKVRDCGLGLWPKLFAGSVTTALLMQQLWRNTNEAYLVTTIAIQSNQSK